MNTIALSPHTRGTQEGDRMARPDPAERQVLLGRGLKSGRGFGLVELEYESRGYLNNRKTLSTWCYRSYDRM